MTAAPPSGLRERGAVGVLMLAVVVIGLVMAAGAAHLGAAVIARARASTAADAAALAAADALALGDGSVAARAAADRVARANDARLLTCVCDGTEATVEVEVDVAGLDPLGGVARARARAEVRPECLLDLPGCGERRSAGFGAPDSARIARADTA